MKLIFPISLVILLFVSCSDYNCNCSYEAFGKIKKGMTIQQVQNILKTKPNKVAKNAEYKLCSYTCRGNIINVWFSQDILEYQSLNTDLFVGGRRFKL